MRRMWARGRLTGFAVLAFALFAVSAPAAAPKKITGKLSRAGLTLIAIDKSGEAASKVAKRNGKFKLKAPAKKVTLHLRGRDGTYAGPVVIAKRGKKGKTAILGIKAPVALGKVKVRKGYAKLRREPPLRKIDRKRKAKAKRGVPRGAGNFGRVRSGASGTPGPGLDQDRDGIPGALDIDDDGDLVLDNLDASSTLRAARGPQALNEFQVGTVLAVPIQDTANSNAGSTDAEIEAILPGVGGRLAVETLPGDSAELDCAGDPLAEPPRPGLIYCSPGGTGSVVIDIDPSVNPPYPECCDPDSDGMGSLPFGGQGVLAHGAVTRRPDLDPAISQIGSGDLLIQRVTAGGPEGPCASANTTCFTATVPYVFATGPTLVSYDDGQGNAAAVDYPVSAGPPMDPGDPGPGTIQNPYPVTADPNTGQIVLELAFWRPQRRPIEDERCPPPDGPECDPSAWIDVGGLRHSAFIQDIEPFMGGLPGFCPSTAYTPADPPDDELTPSPPSPGTTATGFTDLAPDRLASGDALSYRLNVTQCPRGAEIDPGDGFGLTFEARTNVSLAQAVQTVHFELE